ncbi:uncharacterized protein TRIADDRAFT_53373 [Trichoplax adhaerens]|uniref:pyridoxal 5'-phosphate synthase n=1 Tax=Trichoplax adhaerens TaxID=10228 RepID=B3RP21_TRIAD|nr:hypothetical protein TRIADDRAFT_53373 [Trichoplax adhaerens]EDV28115.1 hypothetical protein TRIADDRAFT_53373 [Trichoplax adhaerens]|eukprot:XP_002109949.1 hypothetical protein TRIADDRAFT_53373 [Trichoplax adhaerens]
MTSKQSYDLSNIRTKYESEATAFVEKELASRDDPISQFHAWLEAAKEFGIVEPNAMTLATCTSDGKPSSRTVLLKGYGSDGIKFYTNYESRKGQQLISNPQAAILFYWPPLHRQVRIEGTVEKLSKDESEKYFHSRPRDSQISAAISNQSTAIPNRQYLLDKWNDLNKKYPEPNEIPKPDYWGGFLLKPNYFEFWQGQTNRLHDRICFELTNESKWILNRLSP